MSLASESSQCVPDETLKGVKRLPWNCYSLFYLVYTLRILSLSRSWVPQVQQPDNREDYAKPHLLRKHKLFLCSGVCVCVWMQILAKTMANYGL